MYSVTQLEYNRGGDLTEKDTLVGNNRIKELFYPNGKLESILFDSLITIKNYPGFKPAGYSRKKTYDETGVLIMDTHSFNAYEALGKGRDSNASYDDNKIFIGDGHLVMELVVTQLETVGERTQETNDPYLFKRTYYKNGKILASGNLFYSEANADVDSIDTWKFYDGNGQLIRSAHFESFSEHYKTYLDSIKAHPDFYRVDKSKR
jgi:hypothetical protein